MYKHLNDVCKAHFPYSCTTKAIMATAAPPFVLCVDDDADDRHFMADAIRDLHTTLQMAEATNGKEALQFLEQAKQIGTLPCLILLDLNMPVMNGKEVLIKIKQDDALKDIPTVVFTTSSSELDKLFCNRYQVEIITKPPQYDAFVATVQKLINYCFRDKNESASN